MALLVDNQQQQASVPESLVAHVPYDVEDEEESVYHHDFLCMSMKKQIISYAIRFIL